MSKQKDWVNKSLTASYQYRIKYSLYTSKSNRCIKPINHKKLIGIRVLNMM